MMSVSVRKITGVVFSALVKMTVGVSASKNSVSVKMTAMKCIDQDRDHMYTIGGDKLVTTVKCAEIDVWEPYDPGDAIVVSLWDEICAARDIYKNRMISKEESQGEQEPSLCSWWCQTSKEELHW